MSMWQLKGENEFDIRPVEAFRWMSGHGNELERDPQWAIDAVNEMRIRFRKVDGTLGMTILNENSKYTAKVGDFVVRRVDGYLYSVDGAKFIEAYEPLSVAV